MTTPTNGTRPTTEQLIARFGLEALPVEGGLFHQWYRSSTFIAPDVHEVGPDPKPMGTAIVVLLTDDPDSFSGMHRLVTDELWHYYLGDPLELLVLTEGGVGRVVTLGPDVLGGHDINVCVPAGAWMGARVAPGGSWVLFGNTMAPGFTDTDFELALADELIAGWPEHTDRIIDLSRAGDRRRMPKGL